VAGARIPGGRPMRGTSGDRDAVVALDRPFDSDTLSELRNAVRSEASALGLPDGRAAEVVLAVHELAANAVVHGGGAGWARMRVVAEELHCQVSDPGAGIDDARTGTGAAQPWPFRPGRGLWIARNVADRFSMAPGVSGSQVTVVFALPGR
jgi:anti-sigma regulatory factor (Ser/Thr protein kinase)